MARLPKAGLFTSGPAAAQPQSRTPRGGMSGTFVRLYRTKVPLVSQERCTGILASLRMPGTGSHSGSAASRRSGNLSNSACSATSPS